MSEVKKSIRAFSDPSLDYYELQCDFGPLPKGAIFYHDKEDSMYGSIAAGCLKLCWTPIGNCYGGLCGETVFLHVKFTKYPNIFKKVECPRLNLEPGRYMVVVNEDGTIEFIKINDTYPE